MQEDSHDPESHDAWRWLRRLLTFTRGGAGKGDNPYSPLSCLSLLLVLGLIVEIGH